MILSKKIKTPWFKEIGDYLIFSLVIIGVSVIILTKSRAAILSLFFSTCLFLIYIFNSFERIQNIPKKRWFFFTGIIVVASLVVLMYQIRPESANGRLLIWKIALLEMFPENILFGHGIGAFENHYMQYQAQYFEKEIRQNFEILSVSNTPYSFNEFIKLLIEQGSIGLFLFLTILGLVAKKGKEILFKGKEKTIIIVPILSLFSLLIFSLFSYPFSDILIQVIFWINISWISSSVTPRIQFVTKQINFPKVILIFTLSTSLYLNYNQYKNYELWDIIRYEEKKLGDYKKLETKIQHKGLFYQDYASELKKMKKHQDARDILEKAKFFSSSPTLYMQLGRYYGEKHNLLDSAASNYKYVSKALPYKFLPRYRLFRLYDKYSKKELKCQLSHEILNMPVKKKSKMLDSIISDVKRTIHICKE